MDLESVKIQLSLSLSLSLSKYILSDLRFFVIISDSRAMLRAFNITLECLHNITNTGCDNYRHRHRHRHVLR